MKFFWQRLLIAGLLCLSPVLAEAILDLELTRGTDHAIPIALIPFQSKNNAPIATDLMDIITNDIHNSGEFKILKPDNYPQKAFRPKEINFDVWRKAKVEAVFMGSISSISNQLFEVSTQLLNVYQSTDHPSSNSNETIIFKKNLSVQ